MTIQSILASRRDGLGNTREQLTFLASGAAQGTIPDYQLSAWLMAAYLRPLNEDETAWLTMAMASSGARLDLTGLPKPWLDKHSTGGVGDKMTISVLPILAACGLTVVKMSGRGLGITGGTVDKLSSIPGFRLDLSPEEMKSQARKIGLALTGQTPDLAPADKALYALRDVTETVRSIPLIVSSILSKKIAGGAEIVVLDVKCGRGAFMHDIKEAQELAHALVDTGKRCGLQVHCSLTDMDQPLGSAMGNANEVIEAMTVLKNRMIVVDPAPTTPLDRFASLALSLATEALEAAGIEDAKHRVQHVVSSGAAWEKLIEWFQAQGATSEVWDDFQLLPQPALRAITHFNGESGWVEDIDAAKFGQAIVDLGGGRHKKDDELDLSVGVNLLVSVGSELISGQPLFEVLARSQEDLDHFSELLAQAVLIGPNQVASRPLIIETIA